MLKVKNDIIQMINNYESKKMHIYIRLIDLYLLAEQLLLIIYYLFSLQLLHDIASNLLSLWVQSPVTYVYRSRYETEFVFLTPRKIIKKTCSLQKWPTQNVKRGSHNDRFLNIKKKSVHHQS